MTSVRRARYVLGTGALGLAALLAGPQLGTASQAERSFGLGTDPEVAVLRLVETGAFRVADSHYVLYEDGRLVREIGNLTTKAVRETREVTLDLAEMSDLVRIVVDAGLIECGTECIEAKVMEALDIQKMLQPNDATDMTLTIELLSYSGPQTAEAAPASRTIHLYGPYALMYFCPELPELQGLVGLAGALREHFAEPARGRP